MSQYTSFVAVDDTPAEPSQRGAPLQIAQPSEAPAGVDLRAAGGTVNGLANAANVGFAFGVAGLGVGVAGVLMSRQRDATARAAVTPLVGPGVVGVKLTF